MMRRILPDVLVDPEPQVQIVDAARQFGDLRSKAAGRGKVFFRVQLLLLLLDEPLEAFDPIRYRTANLLPPV